MSADAMSIIGKINGRLMDAGDGDPYLALPSKEEIRWLLPLGAPYSRAGVFDFYHPYSLKNKFLKFAVMALIRMRLAGTVLAGNILFKDDSEGTGLKKTLERSLGVKIDISLSVNPLMDKATGIIVNPDGCVIAYSKMGFSDHSAALINNEYESLQKVRALGLVSCDIPEITSFFIENGATCVVETPSAKPCSISRLHLTKKHTVFLSELFGRTQKKGLLEESAAYI
ncbi:MAG: hypothetical protein PHT32_05275, partial [Candidatus Omnitrophica bacterium]|nr:hypothetical protein [Candidatus Omnitrophota bacterium]